MTRRILVLNWDKAPQGTPHQAQERAVTWYHMAGLRINDQKNVIAVTMIIVTAFKICISHRKNGFLNRPNTQVSFPIFLVDFT
jgi:hypothetical protein